MIYVTFIFIIAVLVSADNECDKDDDCDMEGSMCSLHNCICPPSKVANSLHTKCLAVSNGYGSSCEDNVQCSEGLKSGGICYNGSCSCSKGYHYFLGQCWKTSELGEVCKRNEHCFVGCDFEAAICSEGKVCACSPGYYQREYSSCRRASYKKGDACGIYLDCKFSNAVCDMNRTCQSGSGNANSDGFFYGQLDYDGNLIMSVYSKVGDSCKSDKDCPKNSQCNQAKKCSCLKGYYNVNNSTCSPEIGAKCDNDADCLGKNTQCRNGTVCVCKQGYVTSYNGRYCDKMSRDIGWSCLRDEQCGLFGPRSLCINKKCHCDTSSHYVEDLMFCWVQKLIGESCHQNEDCGSGTTVSCVDGTCQCIQGTHPSSNKTDCHNDSKEVGDPCIETLDCVFNNSFCDSKKNKCSCLHGYVNSTGMCLPGVGGNCDDKNTCKAEGSKCVSNICSCNKDFVSSEDFSKCLPVIKNRNETCLEDGQCFKLEAVCENGTCNCLNGSHFVEGWHCFVSKGLNEVCTSAGNCSVLNSECRGHVCLCKQDYYATEDNSSCSGAPGNFEHISLLIILTSIYYFKEIFNFYNFQT